MIGRRLQRNEWKKDHDGQNWIWFHVASLGEFEQGRTLIEYFKEQHPDAKILLTFFSPSGYEIRKNYALADMVLYLPQDTLKNARQLIASFHISIAFFVKYDFWFNYMHELKRNGIPLFLVSGIFRQRQHFFKWHGGWQRKQLAAFTWFFVQNQESAKLLKTIGFNNTSVCGDTRFDRVVKIASEARKYPEIERFIDGKPVYMAGSSWEPDEKFIVTLIKQWPEVKFIIVPHEVDAERITKLAKALPCGSSLITKTDDENFCHNQVLIINTIGMLSSLYRYATLAHIGNGFGSGIHNTLEAAVYGVPVIFGPNYHKFQEAKDLIECGGGFSFHDTSSFLQLCNSLIKNSSVAGNAAFTYVRNHAGATEIIVAQIKKYLK